MNFLEVSFSTVLSLIFVVWVICMVLWVKRGMPIPRYIYVIAITLTLVGAAIVTFALVGGFFEWKFGLGCLVLPAPATYLGWLWMFGPDFVRDYKSKHPTANRTRDADDTHELPF